MIWIDLYEDWCWLCYDTWLAIMLPGEEFNVG